jgi:hypothetical protein
MVEQQRTQPEGTEASEAAEEWHHQVAPLSRSTEIFMVRFDRGEDDANREGLSRILAIDATRIGHRSMRQWCAAPPLVLSAKRKITDVLVIRSFWQHQLMDLKVSISCESAEMTIALAALLSASPPVEPSTRRR